VQKTNEPIGEQSIMLFGNMPRDGGHLFLDSELAATSLISRSVQQQVIAETSPAVEETMRSWAVEVLEG
jgi:hypothetical protein